MKNNKPAIIYIAGNGRSGSTLLDMLLGSLPNLWTVGEANVIPWEFEKRDAKCGCGKSLYECPFWTEVYSDIGDIIKNHKTIKFRDSHSVGKVLRFKEIGRLLFNKGFPKDELSNFCANNSTFFSKIKEKAEEIFGNKIDYIVSASKDPNRLLWLLACPQFEVRFVMHVFLLHSFIHFSEFNKWSSLFSFKHDCFFQSS